MFDRPTLKPTNYLLWLPYCRAYVRAAVQNNRQVIGTINRAAALRMPEAQALRTATVLHSRTGQVIRLEQVEPAWFDRPRTAA